MSNGDADPLSDDGAPDQIEAPAPVKKARAVKTATKKKGAARTAAAKTPASHAAAKSAAAKRTAATSRVAKSTKRSKRTTGGNKRVTLGNSEMFVSREVAGALTAKDLKRLRAIFKRTLKRARKGDTKKKR